MGLNFFSRNEIGYVLVSFAARPEDDVGFRPTASQIRPRARRSLAAAGRRSGARRARVLYGEFYTEAGGEG